MQKLNKRYFLYLVTVMFMIGAVLQLNLFKSEASASCCSYGEECGIKLCCLPYSYQVPCSSAKANYCRRACGAIPD